MQPFPELVVEIAYSTCSRGRSSGNSHTSVLASPNDTALVPRGDGNVGAERTLTRLEGRSAPEGAPVHASALIRRRFVSRETRILEEKIVSKSRLQDRGRQSFLFTIGKDTKRTH